jgi:hypothetical protein
MHGAHAHRHARHRALAPVLALAGVVVALFVASLVAIVLFLRQLLLLFIEVAGYAWPAP